VVDTVFENGLNDAQAAHDLMETNSTTGKVMMLLYVQIILYIFIVWLRQRGRRRSKASLDLIFILHHILRVLSLQAKSFWR
jgi:hypothetical protein